MFHNLRRARRAADSNLGSPVNRDKVPISRINEPESTKMLTIFYRGSCQKRYIKHGGISIKFFTTSRGACFSSLIWHHSMLHGNSQNQDGTFIKNVFLKNYQNLLLLLSTHQSCKQVPLNLSKHMATQRVFQKRAENVGLNL